MVAVKDGISNPVSIPVTYPYFLHMQVLFHFKSQNSGFTNSIYTIPVFIKSNKGFVFNTPFRLSHFIIVMVICGPIKKISPNDYFIKFCFILVYNYSINRSLIIKILIKIFVFAHL
jgi:hypothetical protein